MKARSAPIGACSMPMGKPKFRFTGMLAHLSGMAQLCLLAAALIACLWACLILGRMPRVRQPGYLVMGGLVALVTTGLLVADRRYGARICRSRPTSR